MDEIKILVQQHLEWLEWDRYIVESLWLNINNIVSRVSLVIEANRWEKTIEDTIKDIVSICVKEKTIELTYERYKKFMESIWWNIVNFRLFKNNDTHHGIASHPWKRFLYIESEWINIWDTVTEIETWNSFQVIWIHSLMQLRFSNSNERHNPLKFKKNK